MLALARSAFVIASLPLIAAACATGSSRDANATAAPAGITVRPVESVATDAAPAPAPAIRSGCDVPFPAVGMRFTDVVEVHVDVGARPPRSVFWSFSSRNDESRRTYEVLSLAGRAPSAVRVVEATYGRVTARDLHSTAADAGEIVAEPTGIVPGVQPAPYGIVTDQDRFVLVDGGLASAIAAARPLPPGKRLPGVEAVVARALGVLSSAGAPRVEVRWTGTSASTAEDVFAIVAEGTYAQYATCHGGFERWKVSGQMVAREDGMFVRLELAGRAALEESMCPHTSRSNAGTAKVTVHIERSCAADL